MSSVVHITNANELSISNNQLVMSNIEIENNKQVNKISLKDILAIIIENCRCKITGILQLRLSEKNIPLIICNEKHQPVLHSLGLYNHFQVTMRINEQVNWLDIKKDEIWEKIVIQKIKNQRNLLQSLLFRILHRLAGYTSLWERDLQFKLKGEFPEDKYIDEIFNSDGNNNQKYKNGGIADKYADFLIEKEEEKSEN